MKFDIEAIKSYVSVRRLSYDCDGSGVDCSWYDCEKEFGIKAGVKVWNHTPVFKEEKEKILRAMVAGIGPKVYAIMKIRGKHAMLQEKLVTAWEAGQKLFPADKIDWNNASKEEIEQHYTKNEKRHELTWKFIERMKPDFKELQKKYGIVLSDMGSSNWGFLYGEEPTKENMRIIDFGHCWIPERVNKQEEEVICSM